MATKTRKLPKKYKPRKRKVAKRRVTKKRKSKRKVTASVAAKAAKLRAANLKKKQEDINQKFANSVAKLIGLSAKRVFRCCQINRESLCHCLLRQKIYLDRLRI